MFHSKFLIYLLYRCICVRENKFLPHVVQNLRSKNYLSAKHRWWLVAKCRCPTWFPHRTKQFNLLMLKVYTPHSKKMDSPVSRHSHCDASCCFSNGAINLFVGKSSTVWSRVKVYLQVMLIKLTANTNCPFWWQQLYNQTTCEFSFEI